MSILVSSQKMIGELRARRRQLCSGEDDEEVDEIIAKFKYLTSMLARMKSKLTRNISFSKVINQHHLHFVPHCTRPTLTL